MSWSIIAVEAFCFADKDNNKNYPCERRWPDIFCISNGHCPYLGYSDTTEREIAQFTPLSIIIWDKIKNWWIYSIWDNLVYQFETKHKIKKIYGSFDNMLKSIEIAPPPDEEEIKEDNERKDKYIKWFEEAKKERE